MTPLELTVNNHIALRIDAMNLKLKLANEARQFVGTGGAFVGNFPQRLPWFDSQKRVPQGRDQPRHTLAGPLTGRKFTQREVSSDPSLDNP